jgi:hypothetical protein
MEMSTGVILACAVGLVVCVGLMMVVIPFGMRVAGRMRKARPNSVETKESASDRDVGLE